MKYNPTLDGVRGIAILLVLVAHFEYSIFNFTFSGVFESITAKISKIGTTGVDLFFILSGYLITGILINAKIEMPGKYYLNFYARRILRIFPLYYGVLILIIFILPQFIRYDEAANNMLKLQHYLWLYLSNLNSTGLSEIDWDGSEVLSLGHFWSLAVEEHFYLIWPTVVYFSSGKRLRKICWSFLILSILAGITVDILHYFNLEYLKLLKWSTINRGGALALGSLLFLNQMEIFKQKPFPVKEKHILIFAVVLYLLIIITPRKILYSGNHFQFYISWILYYFTLRYLLKHSQSGTPMNPYKILNSKILVYIGTISYGIYLFHGLLRPLYTKYITEGVAMISTEYTGLDMAIWFSVFIGTSILIAGISYRYYEKPFLRLKRFFR